MISVLRPTDYDAIKDCNETWADYTESNRPWCSIHHVCGSSMIWLQLKEGEPYHLFHYLWLEDLPQPLHWATRRTDGKYDHLTKAKAKCGFDTGVQYLERSAAIDSHAFIYKIQCCPDCWEKRS